MKTFNFAPKSTIPGRPYQTIILNDEVLKPGKLELPDNYEDYAVLVQLIKSGELTPMEAPKKAAPKKEEIKEVSEPKPKKTTTRKAKKVEPKEEDN